MKYYKLLTIVAIALLTQAMTCEEEWEPYPKNALGKPEYVYLNTISSKQFHQDAVGHGWKWEKSFLITENGNLVIPVFEGDTYPSEYYFTADSVIIFKYHQDRNVRWRETYSYDETNNMLAIPSVEYLQVSQLDSLSMETVEAVKGMGYCVNYYVSMMPFELNARMLGFDDITR